MCQESRVDPVTPHGKQPILQTGSGGSLLLLSDLHSGTRKTIELPAGAVTDLAYEAFGSLIAPPASIPTVLLYRGERLDFVSGDYYLRARQYSAELARFPQLDPHPGDAALPITLHRQAYGGNDPIQNFDPTGEMLLSFGFSALAHIGAQLMKAYHDVRRGDQILGAHLARLVDMSVRMNQIITLLQEPWYVILRTAQSARYWQTVLRPQLMMNATRLRSDLPRLRSVTKVLAGFGSNALTAGLRGVPIKMNGFPDFTGKLYLNPLRGVVV
jgi:RHS repeat-associated protein